MRDIKEIEEDIEKLKLELQEAKDCKKTNWKPRYGEKYYFINIRGVIDCYMNDNINDYVINNTKLFKTQVEAEEYREYITAKKEYSTDFTTKELEDDNIGKYYIYFDYNDKTIYKSRSFCFKYMNMTCFTEENVKEFMEIYEKQILKYEFGIEDI